MTGMEKFPDDEWRLDEEPLERVEQEPPSAAATEDLSDNLSRQRLTRAVYVVTAEHLAWYLIAGYALITRIAALGARPLDASPAADALSAYAIATNARDAIATVDATWVTVLQGWIFAAVGATDASSRIVVTLCGLLLIAIGFAMRPILGRAGALAFAAFIAISPSMTYFSRGSSSAIASIALMMAAIMIAERMRWRASRLRAAGLGAAVAMWLSADPIGSLTAAAIVVSLVVVGLVDLVRLDHRRLRIRVWWDRHRGLVILSAIVALVLWIVLMTAFFAQPLGPILDYDIHAAFAPPLIAWHRALHRLVPILAFYEFIVVVIAIVGAAAIVSGRIGDRFAAWSVAWAIVSLAICGALGENSAEMVVAIILPLAILGAFAIEWMHQAARWDSIRYAMAAAVALTVYVQVVTNFVYPAPDTSEAPWRRHALLFWSEPATSMRTVKECERARSAAPDGASALIPDDAPQAQWYLRDFEQTDSAAHASIVVTMGNTESGAAAGNPDVPQFGFEEWWKPDFGKLTVAGAIKYFFTQRAWSDVEIRGLEIEVSKPGGPAREPKP
jgi:predicted membrane-bound mannosyltransferase